MERYRLKNIIILILALLNAFLLVALGIRGSEERTARRIQQQDGHQRGPAQRIDAVASVHKARQRVSDALEEVHTTVPLPPAVKSQGY